MATPKRADIAPIAVTKEQAAELTSIPARAIQEAINGDGSKYPYLPARRLGRRVVITLADLTKWVDDLPAA